MTIKQNLKRFIITSVLVEITTLFVTAGIFYSLYLTKKISNDAKLNELTTKYERLVAEEKGAFQYLNSIESSSDEKKRNVIRKITFEKKTEKLLEKISESQPYFYFNFDKIELDDKYVNVAHVFFKVKLKDESLDDSFYNIYGKILENAFYKIKSKKFRELVKIDKNTWKIVYKKDYI